VKIWIFLLLLALVMGWVAFGQRGLIHLYRMEGKRQQYKECIHRLEEENRKLMKEVELLKDNSAYVENVARKELNLLKENEVHYHLIPDSKDNDKIFVEKSAIKRSNTD
ncbi:MAG: FtsB family cell division protein, partial [Desulfobacteraceae bacterium]